MIAAKIAVNITDLIISICWGAIIIDILLSWILPPDHSVRQFFDFITEPIIRPIRRIMQPLMARSSIPLDLSPIIALVLLSFIRQLLYLLWTAIF